MTTLQASLTEARRTYGRVIRDLMYGPPTTAILVELRGVAKRARGIMDATEEGRTFDAAHQLLDQVGGVLYDLYQEDQCVLGKDGATYSRTCDVDLGHIRMGLSPGY